MLVVTLWLAIPGAGIVRLIMSMRGPSGFDFEDDPTTLLSPEETSYGCFIVRATGLSSISPSITITLSLFFMNLSLCLFWWGFKPGEAL